MTTRILPQEFHFAETSNNAVVRTAVSRELLDDVKIYLPHVRQMRLAAGDRLTVQVMNEAKDTLYHQAEFLVIAAVETQQGVQDDYGSRLRPQTHYQIQRWTPWKSSSLAPVEIAPEPERVPETYVDGEGEVKWNPGRRVHEIVVAGSVVATVPQGEKDRALRIAAGSEPLPVAA